MKLRIRPLIGIILVSLLLSLFSPSLSHRPLYGEEGMLPLSEVDKLDLRAKGFQLDCIDLYNPKGISLIDGIVKLSGCSASFVSPDGLILTNYHCSFRAIQAVTTKEKDYFRDGFSAHCREDEAPAKQQTVRLIESYRDVSLEVLKVVKKKMSYAQRTKAIDNKINKMVVAFEKKNPGKRAEVAEMFQGKTYVLFVYRYLKDIRLVYAPPRSIGEFGGEEDNWMWPRHTGDFAFLRAYTAPDGSSAEYSPRNVPYKPKRFLQIAPEGVKPEDFVFILGYPGRTYRHKPSAFVAFQEEVRLPFIVDLYRWIIELQEGMSKKDRGIAIKLSSSIKGLWNSLKRSRGQLKGLKGLNLVKKRQKEEQALQAFIDADPKRKAKNATLLAQIARVYKEKRQKAAHELTLSYMKSRTGLLNAAIIAYEASIERKKKDILRESDYMERNFWRIKKKVIANTRNYYEPADRAVLKHFLLRAAALKGELAIPAVVEIIKNQNPQTAIDVFLDTAYKNTRLFDKEFVTGLFTMTTAQLKKLDDPLMKLARDLYPSYLKQRHVEERRDGLLDELSARLIDVKKEYSGQSFIPDANSTLRLTHGRVRGYSPADAVYMLPFTSLGGLVAKTTGKEPFDAPPKIAQLHQQKRFGTFAHPQLKEVPVAMLYNTDTTGGNSGSPVLNARGQLVGLNFDRVYEATVNDYAWDENYSRSIGVDIRYVLWFLKEYSDAEHLLKEMQVLK